VILTGEHGREVCLIASDVKKVCPTWGSIPPDDFHVGRESRCRIGVSFKGGNVPKKNTHPQWKRWILSGKRRARLFGEHVCKKDTLGRKPDNENHQLKGGRCRALAKQRGASESRSFSGGVSQQRPPTQAHAKNREKTFPIEKKGEPSGGREIDDIWGGGRTSIK